MSGTVFGYPLGLHFGAMLVPFVGDFGVCFLMILGYKFHGVLVIHSRFLGICLTCLTCFFSTIWERVGDCFAGTCGDVLGAVGKS